MPRCGFIIDCISYPLTVLWLVEQGLTSHSTQFRSFRRRDCYMLTSTSFAEFVLVDDF